MNKYTCLSCGLATIALVAIEVLPQYCPDCEHKTQKHIEVTETGIIRPQTGSNYVVGLSATASSLVTLLPTGPSGH